MQPAPRKSMADAATAGSDPKEEEPLASTTTIKVDTKSPTGKRYVGTFTYSVPTLGDRVDISRLKAEYLAEMSGVDVDGERLAEMFAYLHTTIESKDSDPEWWKGTRRGIDLYEYAPLLTLYAAARAYEVSYLGAGKGDEETDPKKSADGSDGIREGAMGGNVQPPPQRRTLIETDSKGGVRTGTDGDRD